METESEEAEALMRAAPPLAKDLFPQGVLVVAVQGLPEPRAASGGCGTMSSGLSCPRRKKLTPF